MYTYPEPPAPAPPPDPPYQPPPPDPPSDKSVILYGASPPKPKDPDTALCVLVSYIVGDVPPAICVPAVPGYVSISIPSDPVMPPPDPPICCPDELEPAPPPPPATITREYRESCPILISVAPPPLPPVP